MIERPYFVYVAFTPQDTAERRQVTGVSHHPLLDLKLLSTLGYNKLAVTAGPMPLARAMHEVETLKRKMHRPVHRKAFITRAFAVCLRHYVIDEKLLTLISSLPAMCKMLFCLMTQT